MKPEQTALIVGFWLLFLGGAFGIVVGFWWFVTGKAFAEYSMAGLGGAATVTASAVVAYLRSKL